MPLTIKAQNSVAPVHLAAAKGSINCLKWLTQGKGGPSDTGGTVPSLGFQYCISLRHSIVHLYAPFP